MSNPPNPPEDCAWAFRTVTGADPNLQPEKSKQWNLGVVWEPVPGYSIGVDYWKINKTNTIGALTDRQIFTNFDLFEATHIVRSTAAPGSPLPGPIEKVIEITENLGELWTSGIDVDLNLRGPATSFGRLSFNLNGTYVDKWQQQLDGVTLHRGGRTQHRRRGSTLASLRDVVLELWSVDCHARAGLLVRLHGSQSQPSQQ